MSGFAFDEDVLTALVLGLAALASLAFAVISMRRRRYMYALLAGAFGGMCGYAAFFFATFQIRMF